MGDLSTNLVAYYKMDDNAASTVVIDEKGTNGTSIRNTSIIHVDGKIGGALNFNGTSDYIDTNQTFQNVFRKGFTVSIWFKTDEGSPPLGEQYDLLGTSTNMYSNFFSIFQSSGFDGNVLSVIYISNNRAKTLNSASNFFTSGEQDWHFLSTTIYQTGTKISMNLYFDGSLISSTTGNNITMSQYTNPFDLFLGQTNYAGEPTVSFPGSIDNVTIFDKVLSADEIKQLYNESNTFMQLNSTGEQLFSYSGV